jgi:hypothetical protein
VCDVEPVLEEPEAADRYSKGFAAAPENHNQSGWEEQLSNGAAIRLQARAEQANERMSCFMKKQVRMVKDRNESRLRAEQKQQETAHPDRETKEFGGGHRFPVAAKHSRENSRKLAINRKMATDYLAGVVFGRDFLT